MGLFGKKKANEYKDDYILTDDIDNNRYAEWNEQVRKSRNPESLSPEQLLGILPDLDDEQDEVISEEEEIVLDSAEAFKGKTVGSLYEKMLGSLKAAEEEQEESEEVGEEFYFATEFLEPEENEEPITESETEAEVEAEVVFVQEEVTYEPEATVLVMEAEEEPEVYEDTPEEVDTAPIYEVAEEEEEVLEEESPKKEYDPSKDAFADFFRSLEEEPAADKQVAFTESDGAYSSPIEEKEELTEADKRSVEDLLNLIYGTKKSEPIVEAIVTEQAKDEKEDIKLVEDDVKVAEPMPEAQASTEESDEDLEKTRFIEVPEAPLQTPKHSLYKNEYTIDRKAIDDFFNNIDSQESEVDLKKKKPRAIKQEETEQEFDSNEYAEVSVQDVFQDDSEDYKSLDDAARLKKGLLAKRRNLALKMVMTIVLTALMAIFNNSFFALNNLDFENIPNIVNLVLLIATIGVNFSCFGVFLKKEANADACAVASGIVVLIQSLLSLFVFEGVGAGLGVLAGISYCVCLVAKRAVCSAELKSLCIVATNESKFAVNMIDDTHEANEIVSGLADEEACLCYNVKTVNVNGILKNWKRSTPTDKSSVTTVIVGFAVAAICAVAAYFLLSFEPALAVSVFAVSFCLTAAPTLFLLCSLPTKIMTDSLKYYDSTIGGWNAAEALSQCNTIAIKSADLFPAGSVVLHKMNPLSSNRIDSSIAKAAALTIKAESPLANIFKDIIRDQLHNLPVIEDVKYENKLGLSGWIGNECILIGNRTLMENHNVKTPSIDSERMILSAGYKPVYLAIDGKPCILFVVQYSADPGVKFEINRLCNTGVKVLVDTADPNVTKQLLCDRFDLLEEDIDIITRNGRNKLVQKTLPQQSTNGFAVFKDKSSGLLAILSSAIRIMSVRTIMLVMHIFGIVATLAGLAAILYTSGFTLSTLLLAAAFQIVFICIVSAIPYIRRP